MLPHNKPGFFVIQKDDYDGKVRFRRYYADLEALVYKEFVGYRANKLDDFSEDVNDRTGEERRSSLFREIVPWFGFYCAVVVDEGENVVPICELRRIYNEFLKKPPRRYYHYAWRRTAYGGWRHVKTYQEKKAYYDTLEQDYPVKVRGRRKPDQLPDLWDDQYAHNDKSWKTQTKRRHQWKDK